MKSSWRIRLIAVGITSIAILFGVRLYMVQIVHGQEFTDKADSQYFAYNGDMFYRGDIYFSLKNGTKVAAATIMQGYSLAINPSILKDPEGIYTQISEITDIDKENFLTRANKKDDPFEIVKNRLSEEEGNKIAGLGITGVYVYPENWRYYPGESLSAREVGFVAYKDDVLAGRYGVERFYDDVLERASDMSGINVVVRIFTDIGRRLFAPEQSEGNIVLTVDPSVQKYLEEVLSGVQTKYSSQITGGIIMNPHTGDIYAMGSVPNFNLNNFSQEKVSAFSNPLVEDVYELGSIMKPLTVAVGMDTGTITTDTTYNDTGTAVYDGRTIANYDGRARGVVKVQEILNQSLNVGAAWVMSQVGQDAFRAYFSKIFGSKTGIDLPNEAESLVSNIMNGGSVGLATASFGQGIAISPVKMIAALSALANGGIMPTPHVLKYIEYTLGGSKTFESQDTRIFSEATAQTLDTMLTEVTDTALKNGSYKHEHYTIATKTGTAQMADPVHGGYYADRYLHSFFGFFPVSNPQFIILLYTVDPQHSQYASDTFTDPFMHLVDYLINYYEVPPDR